MRTRLFITGMGGMTGQVLTKLALEKGYVVGGTIHRIFPRDFQTLINQNLLKYYSVDLRDSNDTNKAILDFQPNAVINLASKVLGGSDKKVFDYSVYQENISIFNNVLNAVKKLNNLPRFILTSGCLIYDKQVSLNFITEVSIWDLPQIDSTKQPYKASKADQEKILSREDHLDYIIARPTQVTGPGKISGVIEWYIAKGIAKIIAGEKNRIEVKNKAGEVDLLDVRDVVNAYLTLLERGKRGEIYHISTGSPITVEKLAQVFLKVAGLSDKFPIVSTDVEEKVYFRFSPKKLNRLGWKPQFSLKEALTSYWKYFKNDSYEI